MTRPPWCGPLDDIDAATSVLLALIAGTTTHAEGAAACGVSLRTWMRWWARLRELVPAEHLPPRVAGGTPERARRGRERRTSKETGR